ncbi:MAG: extracellular solute-binding protein [Betaproteobacteria bacterium]|nr:MAG: extracellular solute-binding protein [Betaproteobacteria bacterium]
MRVQPVLAAGGVDLERRPHVLGPGERRVGAPLVEHLGAHLEERRLLRRRLVGRTRAAALVILIGCLHGSLLRRERASHTSLLRYDGPDRGRKLIAAAQKEGSFALYTSFAEKDLPTLTVQFEKKYGVKVNVWRAGSEKVLQRTLIEAAAKRHEVDAIHSSALEMETLHREKILQPVTSPYSTELIAGALRPHGEWVATYLSVRVQAYNTRLVKKEDLPKTFQDLLDPRWKGKLGIEANVPEWYSTVVLDMGEEKGIQFFRDLAGRNGISVRRGHSLLNNMVVAGEVPLALTVYQFMPEAARRKGATIAWFVLEPAVARMSGIGIARRAPHPNAALLFYDFMLSTEAQELLVSMEYAPTRANVPSPLAQQRFTLVDPAVALDQSDKWARSFEEVILKRGGP